MSGMSKIISAPSLALDIRFALAHEEQIAIAFAGDDGVLKRYDQAYKLK